MKKLVIGCGFLGLPLAKMWSAGGDEVYATTRCPDRAQYFESLKLQPLVLDTTESNSLKKLGEIAFEAAVIAVGMDRSRHSDIHFVYVDGLKNVLANLHPQSSQVIYISSTGVYGDFGGDWVNESSPTEPLRDGGRACLAAEKALRESPFSDRATILRMAGLYGNERTPSKSAVEAKQWDRLSATGYLNLIHVDDAVAAIDVVAEQKRFGTFLVSDSAPTLRREYYQYLADRFDLGPIAWPQSASPDSNSRGSSSKRISNQKLLTITGLKLRHPDFRSGLRQTGESEPLK